MCSSLFQVCVVGVSTYYRHQSTYLVPLILSYWREKQEKLLADVRQRGDLQLEGDGRSDSPGKI
jgi:hypothetical protein